MNERDEVIKQANELPLGDLAKQVVSGSYTDGVHNAVLIQRCIEAEEEIERLTLERDELMCDITRHLEIANFYAGRYIDIVDFIIEMNDYLNINNQTNIGSSSILHRKMKAIIVDSNLEALNNKENRSVDNE